MPAQIKKFPKVTIPRIAALDLLRGYFMVSIILNHLQWYPSGFDWVAAKGSLLISAAEGFFIISGILLGLIRGRKLMHEPFKVSALLVLSRGVKLYAVSIILMLLFTFIGWLFIDNPGLKPGIRPVDESVISVILGALSFDYIYGWADFLRLYAIFLIMSPLAIWLLRKGKWYIVTAGSILLWLVFLLALSYTGHSAELLMPLSWQLLFFFGLVFGFHWIDIQAWWKRRSTNFKKSVAIPLLSLAAITLLANVIFIFGTTYNIVPESIKIAYETMQVTVFNKEALTLPRIGIFVLWFSLGLYLFTRYEAWITKWFGWILLPFGKNSLYVYIMHAVILFVAHLVLAPVNATHIVVNFFGTCIVLGLIFLAVKTKFLFGVIPR